MPEVAVPLSRRSLLMLGGAIAVAAGLGSAPRPVAAGQRAATRPALGYRTLVYDDRLILDPAPAAATPGDTLYVIHRGSPNPGGAWWQQDRSIHDVSGGRARPRSWQSPAIAVFNT